MCVDKQLYEMSANTQFSTHILQHFKNWLGLIPSHKRECKAKGPLKNKLSMDGQMDKEDTCTQWNITQPLRTQSCHLQQRPGGNQTKWNQSDREQILYDFTYKWNLKSNKWANKTKITDTENRMVVAKGWGWEVGETGEGDQKKQTFSYKINKTWECSVQQGDCSQ